MTDSLPIQPYQTDQLVQPAGPDVEHQRHASAPFPGAEVIFLATADAEPQSIIIGKKKEEIVRDTTETISVENISISSDVFGQGIAKAWNERNSAQSDIIPNSRLKGEAHRKLALKETALAEEVKKGREQLQIFAGASDTASVDRFLGMMTGLGGLKMPKELFTSVYKWRQTRPRQEGRVIDWLANESSDEQLMQFSAWYGERFEALFANPGVKERIAQERTAWATAVEQRLAKDWYSDDIIHRGPLKDREVQIVDPLGMGIIYNDTGAHEYIGGYVKIGPASIRTNINVGGVVRKSSAHKNGTAIHVPASSLSGLHENIADSFFHEADHTLGGFRQSWIEEALTEHDAQSQKYGNDEIMRPAERADVGAYDGYRAYMAEIIEMYDLPIKLLMRAKTDMVITGKNSRELFSLLAEKGEPELLEMMTMLLGKRHYERSLERGNEHFHEDTVAGEVAEQLRDPHQRQSVLQEARDHFKQMKHYYPDSIPRIK